jgi:Ricin-type beta-trefoil lectin domain-like
MKLKRSRLQAQVACALAALGTSALLAGGSLVSPAAASAGRARLAHPAQLPAHRPPNRSARRTGLLEPAQGPAVGPANRPAHRARPTKPGQRPAGALSKRFAEADDVGPDVTPNNTFYMMLDVSGASTSPGAGVIDWWANGGANQKWNWVLVDSIDGIYVLQNQNSGQCLTSDGIPGDQVYQMPCNYGENQEWYTDLPTQYEESVASSATLKNVASGLYLDVYGDSPWPGASIDTWYYNGNPNQYFRIV